MKRIIAALSLLALVFSFTACGRNAAENGKGSENGTGVSQHETTTAGKMADDDGTVKTTVTRPVTTEAAGDVSKPQTTDVIPDAEKITTGSGTTVTDTFIITKADGTYLELNRLIENDTEKLKYCCDIGNIDGSADMNFKAGDYIVLRYDLEIAETYPLQLTVREIFPPVWND